MTVIINTPDDLYRLMIAPNSWLGISYSLSDTYQLGSNINMSCFTSKTIGNTTNNGFQGNIDGMNYTVNIYGVESYTGFFSSISSNVYVRNLNIIYNNSIILDNSNNNVGGLCGTINNNTYISNCSITFYDNNIIGTNINTSYNSGGFCGLNNSIINNCNLYIGNNCSISGFNIGGFCGFNNNGTINNVRVDIKDNLQLIAQNLCGGMCGYSVISNNIRLQIGNNCKLGGGIVGGIYGETTGILGVNMHSNHICIYGNNTIIQGSSTSGGMYGILRQANDSSNNIVLFKNNTRILGTTRSAGLIGQYIIINESILPNGLFCLFNDYSIIGNISNAILDTIIPNPIIPDNLITNTCGNPLEGSNITNMSTTLLNNVINYCNNNTFLQTIVPYILETYCNESANIPIMLDVINNNCRTSDSSLLLYNKNRLLEKNKSNYVKSQVETTVNNLCNITNNIQNELIQIRQQRYQPYQPYRPMIIPQHVIDFQRNTNNSGIPHSFFTASDCKGVQSVTT